MPSCYCLILQSRYWFNTSNVLHSFVYPSVLTFLKQTTAGRLCEHTDGMRVNNHVYMQSLQLSLFCINSIVWAWMESHLIFLCLSLKVVLLLSAVLFVLQTHYSDGDFIIRQGATGDTFYIISKGQVKACALCPLHGWKTVSREKSFRSWSNKCQRSFTERSVLIDFYISLSNLTPFSIPSPSLFDVVGASDRKEAGPWWADCPFSAVRRRVVWRKSSVGVRN